MDFEKFKNMFFGNNSKEKNEDSGISTLENGKNNKEKKSTSKKTNNLIVLALVGVCLLLVGSLFKDQEKMPTLSENKNQDNVAIVNEKKSEENNNSEKKDDKDAYKEKVQNELISILEKIEGVGKVEAMIYFQGGEEYVPAVNENDSKSTTEEIDNQGGKRNVTQENGGSTVVMSNDSGKTEPLIVKTYNPKITGICVVAEGAGDKITELRVRQAVTNLFALEEEKVQVYPMKN